MLHRVALVRTDVSEERSASIIRVTRIDELGTLDAKKQTRLTFFLPRICDGCCTANIPIPEENAIVGSQAASSPKPLIYRMT
jgi:hypothetical protein